VSPITSWPGGVTTQPWAAGGKPMTLAVAGVLGALVAFIPGELLNEAIGSGSGEASLAQLILLTSVWMLIYAIGYSIAMVIGQNRYLRRPLIDQKEAGIAAAGGALAGLVSGGLAQAFFSVAVYLTIASGAGSLLLIEIARIAAWAIFGALIGLGMSFFIPNLGRLHGFIGGAVGGAVGAIGFILAKAVAGDLFGRLIGMGIVGAALGFAIGLVEQAFRAAWLQVSFGNAGEGRMVSLGNEPVCIGSDARRCAVWTPGGPAMSMRFRFAEGKVTCDDVVAERSAVVPPGFQQQIGSVRVIVCVGASGAATGGAPPAMAVMVPPPPPPPSRPKSPPPAAVSPPRGAGPQSPPAATRKMPPPPPPPPPR
jgi:hypothetical protein